MKILNYIYNIPVLITLAQILYLGAVFQLKKKEQEDQVISVLAGACFLLFAVLHRYSSQISMGSPVLQIMFLFALLIPWALYLLIPDEIFSSQMHILSGMKLIAGSAVLGAYLFLFRFPYAAAFSLLAGSWLSLFSRDKRRRFAWTVFSFTSLYAVLFSSAAGLYSGTSHLTTAVRLWISILWGLSFFSTVLAHPVPAVLKDFLPVLLPAVFLIFVDTGYLPLTGFMALMSVFLLFIENRSKKLTNSS